MNYELRIKNQESRINCILSFSLFVIRNSLFLLLMLSPTLSWAKTVTIHGQVTNGTTGQPAQVDEVRLIQLKEGMKVLLIQRDLKGSYRFDNAQLEEDVPHLIQVSYQGVSYSTPLMPDQIDEKPLQTTVYDTTDSWENITIRRAMWVLLREKTLLKIQKIFILENEGQVLKTFAHPEETFRFYIPIQANESRSVTVSTGMMPLRQAMTQIENSNFHSIQYPIKPGQTQVMIQYEMDFKDSLALEEQLSYDIEELDLLIYPTDMKVKGDLFENKGIHPEIGLLLLKGGPFKKGQQVKFEVSGGTVIEEPQVIDVPNRTQNFLIPIVAGLSLVLIFGSLPALRRNNINSVENQKNELLNELLKLNTLHKGGKISNEQYEIRRNYLKSQLLHLMKNPTR